MDSLHQRLIQWMAFAIHSDNTRLNFIPEADWHDLYKIIFEQGMGMILFPVASRLPEESRPDPKLFGSWKKQVLFAATMQLYKVQQLKDILETFKLAGIPVIVFKGPAIARFYDKPECRLMSDVDILVESKDKFHAQKEIENMGYTLVIGEDDHPMHCGYHKKGSLNIELHNSLLHPGFLGLRQVDGWYRHIWEYSRVISTNGLEFRAMAVEDELINQLLHFATHLIYAGARMKHLYDIALTINNCENDLDWQYIKDTLKTIKLLKFGTLVFTICQKYLHVIIPEDMITPIKGITVDEFLDRFLTKYSIEKEPGDQKGWKMISWRLPVLCKYSIMLPFALLIEVFVQIGIHKGKVLFSLHNSWNNIKIFRSKTRTLKSLGLQG